MEWMDIAPQNFIMFQVNMYAEFSFYQPVWHVHTCAHTYTWLNYVSSSHKSRCTSIHLLMLQGCQFAGRLRRPTPPDTLHPAVPLGYWHTCQALYFTPHPPPPPQALYVMVFIFCSRTSLLALGIFFIFVHAFSCTPSLHYERINKLECWVRTEASASASSATFSFDRL